MTRAHNNNNNNATGAPDALAEGRRPALKKIGLVDLDDLSVRRVAAAIAHAGFETERYERLQDVPEGAQLVVALLRFQVQDDAAAAPLDRHTPGVHVVALVDHPRDARRALAWGADSAVVDDGDLGTLAAAIQAAAVGLAVQPLVLVSRSLRRALTAREKQILALVVMGFANAEISVRLHIAETTVKSHLSSIFRKLQVTSRHEATAVVLDAETGAGLGVLALT
jgi:DNA-binding NarL/FixJ family response regulator